MTTIWPEKTLSLTFPPVTVLTVLTFLVKGVSGVSGGLKKEAERRSTGKNPAHPAIQATLRRFLARSARTYNKKGNTP